MLNMLGRSSNDNNNDCLIVGGKLISVGDHIDINSSSEQPVNQIIPEPVKCTNPSKSFDTLPTTPSYLPCYLYDEDYRSDYGLFLSYCTTALSFSERYLADIMACLRYWRKMLKKSGDTIISINTISNVLAGATRSRQCQLLQALRRYSEYRDFYGDPRLIILIARGKFKRPVPSSKAGPVLNRDEFFNYWRISQYLCADLSRVGVWLALCCLGIKGSEVRRLEINNGHFVVNRKKGVLEIKYPQWLKKTLDLIPDHHWRQSRQSILKGIRGYGTLPQTLYNTCKLYPPPVRACKGGDGGREVLAINQ